MASDGFMHYKTDIFKSDKFFLDNEMFFINKFTERMKENIIYHTHEFVEICYVYSGNGCHIVDDKEYKVQKGDIFIINYDMRHSFYSINKVNPLITYNIMFKPCFFDGTLLDFNDFNSLTMSYLFNNIWNEDISKPNLRLSAVEQQDFDLLISNIYKEYTIRNLGYLNIIRAYLIELIIKIMRSLNNVSIKDKVCNKKEYLVNSILSYLSDNYKGTFDFNELAAKIFYSKNYLSKIFKESTGITLSDYMQNLRINEACTLIKHSDKRIIDIAYEVGYSDYKSFITTFKRIKGITPSEYRKIN